MKKKSTRSIFIAVLSLAAFALWTVLVRTVDVREIGPNGSAVGFAALNGFVHKLTGVNMTLYTLTDWLGLVPVAAAFGFAILGAVQWLVRKSIFKVDRSLAVLGAFYIAVAAAYVLFEIFPVNYRPVLIDGHLEASYPSSTTLLVMCIMPTAAMQACEWIKNKCLKRCIVLTVVFFTAFMIFGRILSGVHWISDIVGGMLLSSGLVLCYVFCVNKAKK